MTTLVRVPDQAKGTGLVQLRITAVEPASRLLLQKVAALNGTWNKFKGWIEADMSARLGRKVVLLNGNYVKQKGGVVSYHGAVKVPGAVYLQRKGYDTATNTFWLWVIVK